MFYLDRHEKDESLPNSYVKQTYSGFDSGIYAFLLLGKNDRAEVVLVAGGLLKK